MDIVTGLEFHLKNSGVSLGKFDGIHKGHRYLLSRIREKKPLISTAFTFEMDHIPKIYTQKEKNQILEALGIEREVIFPFREDTKSMSAEDFIRKILVDRLDAKYICVGEDFRFGKNRSGDAETLRQFQEKYGYEVEVVKKLTCENEIISSTRIRGLLEQGEVEKAGHLLGGEYFVSGIVSAGEELGRRMDSPTANLLPDRDKLLPRFGVYATSIWVDGRQYFGVTNVGVKPTVGEFPAGLETNIFRFHEDIYGKKIRVGFCKFLREERRFPTLEALKGQIGEDRKRAVRYLQKRYPEYRID